MSAALRSCASVALRDAAEADRAFLIRLFASTREAELAALPASFHASFVESQYRTWSSAARATYPGARHQIILGAQRPGSTDEPVGALLTNIDDESTHLIDIALLPSYRGFELGTIVLERLIEEASARCRPVRLAVIPTNPALRLYERLGFRRVGQDGFHLRMERPFGLSPQRPQPAL